MNEGKFKERILEILENQNELYLNFLVIDGKLSSTLDVKTFEMKIQIKKDLLNRMLDEAFIEFPNIEDYGDCTSEDDHYIFLLGEYEEALNKWLLKWRGDKK